MDSLKRHPFLLSATTLISGVVIGYFIGKRDGSVVVVPPAPENHMSNQDVESEEVIDDSRVYVIDRDMTPEELQADPVFQKLIIEEERIATENNYRAAVAVPEPVNVFKVNRTTDVWIDESERSTRDPAKPYVIHMDEFVSEEMGYRQVTVTYYVGDDILADSLDTPVHNHRALLGDLLWGHGTNGDANLVYIRNEKEKMEYEVIRHSGSFEIEVLGNTMEEEADRELHHSSNSRVPRMRRE